jgi:ABC-2 type transport system permease protein
MSSITQSKPSPVSRIAPFYWSLRRELWEHRAIYIAPVAISLLVFVGFLTALPHLPRAMELSAAAVHAHNSYNPLLFPYQLVILGGLIVGFVVRLFYSLGALHDERRDRSVLFWKSLPVSDVATVFAKAVAMFVVLPIVVYAVMVVIQAVMLALSAVVIAVTGGDVGRLWAGVDLPFMWSSMAVGFVYLTLWQAPAYAWILMVSGWARRTVFLWAAAPLAIDWLVESLVAHKPRIETFLFRRFVGGAEEAFTVHGLGKAPVTHMSDLEPARLFGDPQLAIGLFAAAAFIAIAVLLRRRAAPI